MIESLEGMAFATIEQPCSGSEFDDALVSSGCQLLTREQTTTLQINLGRLCNQACTHCHVDAGPALTDTMRPEVMQRTMAVLAASSGIHTVDFTGGAPELNANFRLAVIEVRRLGFRIIDRCNLTVLSEPGMERLAEFLAENEVEVCASLPCYSPSIEKQRGPGSFLKSIRAIRSLNSLGYGMPDSKLRLNLVYNPLGASLPPPQEKLEDDYRQQLREHFGVEFNRLFTITNMPIGRFKNLLRSREEFGTYMGLLVNHFNPRTLSKLMCRSLVSVGYDGLLYDCDFNQMLGNGIEAGNKSIWTIDSFDDLNNRKILTGCHCFGCTADDGSSCRGSLQ